MCIVLLGNAAAGLLEGTLDGHRSVAVQGVVQYAVGTPGRLCGCASRALARKVVGLGIVQHLEDGLGVFYSCLGHREGAYNPCPKWARMYRLMTESGSKAFPASRAPEV